VSVFFVRSSRTAGRSGGSRVRTLSPPDACSWSRSRGVLASPSGRGGGRPVLLLDRNPVVAGVWDYLLHVRASEVLRLPIDVGSVEDLPSFVPLEARNLVGFWLSRARSSPARSASAWARTGCWPGSFWGEAVRLRIASQLLALRGWRVRCADFHEAPDGPDISMFVDPPYEGPEGDHYRRFRHVDHEDLGAWCCSRAAQVIACGGPNCRWLPFRLLREARTTRGSSREYVWEKAAGAPFIRDSRTEVIDERHQDRI